MVPFPFTTMGVIMHCSIVLSAPLEGRTHLNYVSTLFRGRCHHHQAISIISSWSTDGFVGLKLGDDGYIVPFIITEELKLCYYRGLAAWNEERGDLCDTVLSAQDQFRQRLEYFRIPY